MIRSHPGHHARLDLHFLAVGLPLDVAACEDLLLGEHSGLGEHSQGLRRKVCTDHFRDVGLGVETAAFRLFLPLFGVAVPVEADDVEDGADNGLERVDKGDAKVLALSQFGVEILLERGELLGDGSVERGHRLAAIGRGTDGAELEAVAGEGERRGAVAVGA